MIYRPVEEKDRQQLLQLHHDFHIGFHREIVLKDSPLRSILAYSDETTEMVASLDEMYDDSHISFVAEENGRILGFISGKVLEIKGKRYDKEGYIDDWYMIDGQRGKGVGKKLYSLLVSEFKKRHCTHLAISAYAENADAIALYRKLGFHDFTLTLKKELGNT